MLIESQKVTIVLCELHAARGAWRKKYTLGWLGAEIEFGLQRDFQIQVAGSQTWTRVSTATG